MKPGSAKSPPQSSPSPRFSPTAAIRPFPNAMSALPTPPVRTSSTRQFFKTLSNLSMAAFYSILSAFPPPRNHAGARSRAGGSRARRDAEPSFVPAGSRAGSPDARPPSNGASPLRGRLARSRDLRSRGKKFADEKKKLAGLLFFCYPLGQKNETAGGKPLVGPFFLRNTTDNPQHKPHTNL